MPPSLPRLATGVLIDKAWRTIVWFNVPREPRRRNGADGSLEGGGIAEFRLRNADEDGGGTALADYVWKPVALLLATPLRWGQAGSLYFRMAERLNCVQNQITIKDRVLINKKFVSFIITGGQDNIQGVAGQLLSLFWSWVFVCRNFRSSPIRAVGLGRTRSRTPPT